MEIDLGTDIHIHREALIDGKWTGLDNQEFYEPRNYALFALLAKGVRGEFPLSFEARGVRGDFPLSFEARGMPNDADCVAYDDSYNHNHSYLHLSELKDKALELLLLENTPIYDRALEGLLIIIRAFDNEKEADNHRIVFWFDN